MERRITRLTVLQTGKLLAVLYGFMSVIMLPFFLIGLLMSPKEAIGFFVMILLYPIIGFIGGVLMAALYNLAANLVGGLEVSVESIETAYSADQSQAGPQNTASW